MPIPNSKSLPSLRGVFPTVCKYFHFSVANQRQGLIIFIRILCFLVPKPKRNFLKENKLKIREITPKIQLPPDKFTKLPARSAKRVSSSTSRSNCLCPCNCGIDNKNVINNRQQTSKVNSCVFKTVRVCDQEIQTEEIHDESFLLSSLKKCTSNEVQNAVVRENLCEEDDDIFSQNFQALEINQSSSHHNGMNSENATNRSCTSNYSEMNKKREIKLPKYLQKEKREKEEQRLKEESRDPNCPPGHYALLEEEKESCLKSAEKSKYII